MPLARLRFLKHAWRQLGGEAWYNVKTFLVAIGTETSFWQVAHLMMIWIVQRLRKFHWILNALRRAANIYPEGSIVVIRRGFARGLKWKRHHRYIGAYWWGHYEMEMQEALHKLIKPGDTIFDVGANAGFFSMLAAHFAGPAGKCIAFDPSPENCASIEEQLRVNELKGSVVQKAVADAEGKATFWFATPSSPYAHLGEARESGERGVEVTVTTLDAVSNEYGNPQLIKMDIEGAEVLAMRGAATVIGEARPIFLIELHGPDCERVVKDTLRKAGYAFFNMDLSPVPPSAALPRHVIARHADPTVPVP